MPRSPWNPVSPTTALRTIKVVHTVAWAFFAGLILALPLFAWRRDFGVFVVLAAIVAVEVVVLALNGLKCPLTPLAARYTTDRRDNFDIFLPLFVARYNKQIFGPLYMAGLLFGLVRWLAH
jgi:hypothetical protein